VMCRSHARGYHCLAGLCFQAPPGTLDFLQHWLLLMRLRSCRWVLVALRSRGTGPCQGVRCLGSLRSRHHFPVGFSAGKKLFCMWLCN
jgi:hypothetical protein